MSGDQSSADEAADQSAEHAAVPVLRVVKGEPTAEELAALVAVISARHAAAAVEPPQVRRSGWSARDRSLRGLHHAGPGGWRASARPR